MNRLLLQEWLDELRSDDSVELTEGNKARWTKRRKEKRRLKRQRQTAISGVQNRPSGMSQSGTPTESGSNAGQQTRVKAPNYTPEQEAKATSFLQTLANLFGESMDNVDHTLYIHSQKNGNQLVFRLANHRGDARQFTRRGELVGNFGVVIKMNEKRFKADGQADYEEEVFFPDKLTDEKMKAISDGVANYIQTGVYNGPKGDESNPQEPLHPNPVNQSVPWQQPQPPATPPTEPGVQEAFFSRFSNLDYLYQILDEGKDRLIDRLPSLDDAQKTQMKQFFAKRPSLESKFDWNRPDTITWDAFQNIANGYEDPIDPDTVPELSDKRVEGNGIVSYAVKDTFDSCRLVRRIVDTHWGKDSNPWCLISREAESEWGYDDDDYDGLSGAWEFWEKNSLKPKRIAFKDGRLLAFMAVEGNRYEDPALELSEDAIKRLFPERYKEFEVEDSQTNCGRYLDFVEWMEKAHPDDFDSILDDNGDISPDIISDVWWDRNDNPHPSVHDCA